MTNPLIKAIDQAALRSDIPEFRPGDSVRVHVRVVEGSRSRVQVFGQAATQAPQPMQVALSNALSDSRFGAAVAWASGAEPVLEEM